MKKILTAIVILIATTALSAQDKNFIDQNYIEINASATKEVSPDEIFVSITIEEKDNKSKSLEKQEKEMFARLKALGIDLEKDMLVKDMATQVQEYILRKNTVVTSKSYQLKITSTDMLIKVFKELEKLSIPNVSIVKTDVSDKEKVKNEVMIMASEKAKSRAEILANSFGKKLGKAIYIQHNEGYQRDIVIRGMYALGAKAADVNVAEDYAGPDLAFGKISFTQNIFVRFSLE
ncbi:MAG: SIMPL domain-containing protein [Bacteroidales bacterium]|nr:SIMPL domain-containing protein [Bacteroidales bacterium]